MTNSIQNLFQNQELWAQCLQLARGNRAAAYERLEFLGDRVLAVVVDRKSVV